MKRRAKTPKCLVLSATNAGNLFVCSREKGHRGKHYDGVSVQATKVGFVDLERLAYQLANEKRKTKRLKKQLDDAKKNAESMHRMLKEQIDRANHWYQKCAEHAKTIQELDAAANRVNEKAAQLEDRVSLLEHGTGSEAPKASELDDLGRRHEASCAHGDCWCRPGSDGN